MTQSARLLARNPIGWNDVVVLLDGATCAWADIDGWHCGTCPSEEPAGGVHLWAWKSDWCGVVRLGGHRPVFSELLLAGKGEGEGELVELSVLRGLSWADNDKGVRIPPETGDFEMLGVTGPAPLWFVRPAS